MNRKRIGRIIITSLAVLMISLAAAAQDAPAKKKSDFMDRLRLGGYLGLQFGTITYIDVSPMLMYAFTDRFYGGIGGSYMFFKDKRYVPSYTSNTYGGRTFLQYIIWQGLFAHVEYELLNVDFYDPATSELGRTNLNNVFIGGGYRQAIAGRSFASITILYNLNDSMYSPYQNPLIRIGFGIGL